MVWSGSVSNSAHSRQRTTKRWDQSTQFRVMFTYFLESGRRHTKVHIPFLKTSTYPKHQICILQTVARSWFTALSQNWPCQQHTITTAPFFSGNSGECRPLAGYSLPVAHLHLGAVFEAGQWTTLVLKGKETSPKGHPRAQTTIIAIVVPRIQVIKRVSIAVNCN